MPVHCDPKAFPEASLSRALGPRIETDLDEIIVWRPEASSYLWAYHVASCINRLRINRCRIPTSGMLADGGMRLC